MFIVFEGIDGSGKDTLFEKFYNYLWNSSKYSHILCTREPYKSREARKILQSDNDPYSKSEELTELFMQDRKEHIRDIISPNLKKLIILSNRYKYSTICYQAAQGQDMEKIIEMHRGMPVPDLTFILDVSTEVAERRIIIREDIEKEGNEPKFEKNKDFLEKVRQNYLIMPKKFPKEKIHIIIGDRNRGDRSIESIFEDVKEIYINTKQEYYME